MYVTDLMMQTGPSLPLVLNLGDNRTVVVAIFIMLIVVAVIVSYLCLLYLRAHKVSDWVSDSVAAWQADELDVRDEFDVHMIDGRLETWLIFRWMRVDPTARMKWAKCGTRLSRLSGAPQRPSLLRYLQPRESSVEVPQARRVLILPRKPSNGPAGTDLPGNAINPPHSCLSWP